MRSPYPKTGLEPDLRFWIIGVQIDSTYMPRIAARTSLHSMWPLIHAAQSRSLTIDERNELRRHCDILASLTIPIPDFTNSVELLRLAIHSSGVSANDGKMQSPERILEYLDEIDDLLKEGCVHAFEGQSVDF